MVLSRKPEDGSLKFGWSFSSGFRLLTSGFLPVRLTKGVTGHESRVAGRIRGCLLFTSVTSSLPHLVPHLSSLQSLKSFSPSVSSSLSHFVSHLSSPLSSDFCLLSFFQSGSPVMVFSTFNWCSWRIGWRLCVSVRLTCNGFLNGLLCTDIF